MIDEADRDNDGKINAEEFFRVMKKRGDNPLDDWDSGQQTAHTRAHDAAPAHHRAVLRHSALLRVTHHDSFPV